MNQSALLRPDWTPATIALMILGFVVFWPLGLAMLAKPIGKALSAVWRKRAHERQHRTCNRNLVGPGQRRGPQEGGRRVQRRRQSRGADLRSPPAGFDEGEAIKPSNLLRHPDAAVEVEQVGAASQQDMLTVIYNLPCSGVLVGGGSASDKRPALEKSDSKSRLGECTAGREPGDASTDNSDSRTLLFVGHGIERRFPIVGGLRFSGIRIG